MTLPAIQIASMKEEHAVHRSSIVKQRFLSFSIFISFILTIKGDCEFPAKWSGEWFQSGKGNQLPVVVNTTHFYGSCKETGKANRYLVYVEHERCYKCMVITMKHNNVIQYKESYCNPSVKDLPSHCKEIPGDATLFSMFRLNTDPVSCPFRGPLTFSYNKNYGECSNPPSQIDSCADDSRLLIRQQACADVLKSESKEEELVCLGDWKEGPNFYMVGKINHSHANTDEDRYRCFIFEPPIYRKQRRQTARSGGGSSLSSDAKVWHLSMSADATCQGLVSPYEGGKTMKLTKGAHGSKKCKFPSWLSANRHWHTLNNSKSYFLYHRNTSLNISNGASPPENPDVRGHTDIRLVCHQYKSSHDPRDGHREQHRQHHKSHHDRADSVTIIVHFTVACRSGYKCMRIYRRDDYVVQVQFGQDALNAEEACKNYYWKPSEDNLITLISDGGESRGCGPSGRYQIPEYQRGPCDGGSTVGHSYTHLTVGCSHVNPLQLKAQCPENTLHSYQCHGQWKSDDVTFVVASPLSRPSGAPRRVCFAYSPSGGPESSQLLFTARHDTCIARGNDARLTLNVTLLGQCTEAPGLSSSSNLLEASSPFKVVLISLLLTVVLEVQLLLQAFRLIHHPQPSWYNML